MSLRPSSTRLVFIECDYSWTERTSACRSNSRVGSCLKPSRLPITSCSESSVCHRKDWHVSPEQSLLLHAENIIIPSQVIIYSPKGHNNTVELLFRTSLYDLKEQQFPSRNDLVGRARTETKRRANSQVVGLVFGQNSQHSPESTGVATVQ